MSASITKNRYAFRSLWFHRKLAISVSLGVATAATVITGALIVGDSMRGSLRSLTIDRLGRIDQLVIPGGFFEASGIPATIDSRTIVPAIYFDQGVVETTASSTTPMRRASSIQILGIDNTFKSLDALNSLPNAEIGIDQIILNRAAADELSVSIGDMVTLRLPSEQAVPADSPLGKRDSQTEGIPRLKVVSVIDNRGLGRFALNPSQIEPLTAFLSRETIAATLDRSGQANVLFISQQPQGTKTNAGASVDDAWVSGLPLRLADLGLKLSRVTKTFATANGPATTVFDYYQLTSDRLLLPKAAVEKLTDVSNAAVSPQPAMTYLANAIERIDKDGNATASVPYSIVTAIDSSHSLTLDYGSTSVGNVGDDTANAAIAVVPMVLNDWTATALSASIGDRLRILFYEPEVESGREIEKSFDGVLTAIVPITKPVKPYRRSRPHEFDIPPTVYNDTDLTPSVPGVTDQDSISDWDLPFKLDRKISSEDDKYWAEHRLTPKVFIPLKSGQRLFGSRFGDTTSLRFSVDSAPNITALEDQIRASLLPIRGRLGWSPIKIRDAQIAASRGTTPFDALFLSLSMFVILAAVMLISLLYRLGMLQRGREYGLLLATGWSGRDVSRLAIREGLISSIPGILLGTIGGLGYAWLVLAALRSWWVGAVTVPFLEFHATPRSLLIGGLATLSVAMLTIWTTARRLRRATAQSLLAGRVEDSHLSIGQRQRSRHGELIIAGVLVVAAIGALVFGAMSPGTRGSGLVQAGAFVGSGMLLLIATLMATFHRLSLPHSRGSEANDGYTLWNLSSGNLKRNPLRSTLAIGLMAVATFLIVSIGAFQLRPTAAGVGGFSLIGKTATPLYRDLNDPLVQSELLGQDRDSINDAEIVSLRLKSGQDASCNNLYQAKRPQVLAVPAALAKESKRVSFDWAEVLKSEPVSPIGESPWRLLEKPATGSEDDPIPLVLDQNTAMWSLQLMGGAGSTCNFAWVDGKPIYFRVVGLLSNSVLQGSLIIGEDNFKQIFPEINGYQVFLVATTEPVRVAGVLENRLGDVGMDLTDSAQVLSRMMAVQNTYLKTFQSLGALGLLLGTFGLAIAQLRSVLERQGELAVLRAIGFGRYRLAGAVMIETVALLGAGIGCGLVCSAIAIAPHAFTGQLLPPVSQPLIAVTCIAMVGLVAGLVTVGRVVRMPLIESLRKV